MLRWAFAKRIGVFNISCGGSRDSRVWILTAVSWPLTFVYTHITYIYTHVHTCTHTCIHMHTLTHIYTRTLAPHTHAPHARTRARAHTHIHGYTRALILEHVLRVCLTGGSRPELRTVWSPGCRANRLSRKASLRRHQEFCEFQPKENCKI